MIPTAGNVAPDWDLYQSFLAVARAGTLAGGAAALGTSTSSVHREIARLERALGATLFERRGRVRVLTAAGEVLARRAADVEEELVAIARELAGADQLARGTVHLTTTDATAYGLLPRYLRPLRERHPGIQLHVTVDNRHYRLGRGEADVALRPGGAMGEPDVVERLVGEVALAYYASRDYLARHGRPRRKRDLAAHDAVVVDQSLAHIAYGRLAAEHTDPSRRVLRSPSILAQAAAVSAGAGIAALPCFLMDPRPEVERLFRPEPEGPLYVLYPAELRRVARVRAVVELLTELIAADGPLLSGAGTNRVRAREPRA